MRTKLNKMTLDQIDESQAAHRHKSVFNLFYMNDKYRDLMSVKTARGDCQSTVNIEGQMQVQLRDLHTNAPTMIKRL